MTARTFPRRAALLASIALIVVVFVAPVLYGQAQPFKVLVYSEIPSDSNVSSRFDSRRHYGDSAARPAGQLPVDIAINLSWTAGSPSVFSRNAVGTIRCNRLLSPNSNALLSPTRSLPSRLYPAAAQASWVFTVHRRSSATGTGTGSYWAPISAVTMPAPNMNAPPIADATVNVISAGHPSTNNLPPSWSRNDEWYNVRYNSIVVDGTAVPAISVTTTPLIKVDENTYAGEGIGAMGDPHPVSWYQQYDGGRSFVTTMGHTAESYAEQNFRQHLLGGILWAAGRGAAPSPSAIPSPSSSAAPSATANPSTSPSAAATPAPGGTLPRRGFVPLVQGRSQN